MNSNCLVDYLEVWGFDRNFVIFGDGSIGAALKLTPLDVSCWSDDRVNGLVSKLRRFLSGLPEGLDLQFVQDIEAGNSKTIASHQNQQTEKSSTIVEDLLQQRCEGLNALDEQGLLPCHRLSLFLRMNGTASHKPSLWRRAKSFGQLTESYMEAATRQLQKVLDDFKDGFFELGIDCTRIPSEDLFSMVYRQWNPLRPGSSPTFENDDIRSSLLFTDLGLTEKGFQIGSMHHRVISLKGMPDQTFASMASLLRGLPFDSRLFLSIHVPNQIKELEQLQTQRRIAFSMVQGKQSGVRDIESTAKLEDLETVLEEMISDGEQIFQVSMNIVLRSTNHDELDVQVSQVLTRLRDLSGAEGMIETGVTSV